MKRNLAFPFLIALSAFSSSSAIAANLPAIKAGGKNTVPECVTPGRLWSLLKARNSALDARYDAIATDYMRHGEELGLRWDYAFYQMIIETGALTYRNGNKAGDVKPAQNNFAGLGATGKGEHGESFKDVSTGVRAHLQHLTMYSGLKVEDPVAERTRKVQEWGVLTSWHGKFSRPITYNDMAQKWAPGSRDYPAMLEAIAEQFNQDFCRKTDPRPELVQEARGKLAASSTKVADAQPVKGRISQVDKPARDEAVEKISGADLYRRSVEEARAETTSGRSALGAGGLATKDAVAQPTTIINAPKAEAVEPLPVQTVTAVAAGAATAITPPAAAPGSKCHVFTASYGGQKAVIIKASASEGVNYTVLDVNEGAEKRETEAFIQAYAKGGQLVAEYSSQNQALDKAFELCPEG